MKLQINQFFERHHLDLQVRSIQPVHGGDINDNYRIETNHGPFFLKYQSNAPKEFLSKEVEGIKKLKETNSFPLPEIHAIEDTVEESFLLLDWINGEINKDTSELFGQHLTTMHQTFNEKHGYGSFSYIGTLKQENKLYDNWTDYYAECRLQGQLEIGTHQGVIRNNRAKQLYTLIEDIDQFIPKDVKPSYLHGDLWSGNWIPGENGIPYLIDPSFLYGDRHFELAFIELFGGFEKEFCLAYESYYPVENYYKDVKEIYQLFYLLVHLNMFGEAYGSSVDRILSKYVGDVS
ncbi:fructosamine kinase family protein [Halalkalibacillus halophilus]|uniref:fructosamine kinase family protein n=1 Tax=Halalkalibacillus halophilus TaxID=392827 RepID=UPI0003F588C0|nr:fructosamine kinase family protein [Halalkalibacillus halophilus]